MINVQNNVTNFYTPETSLRTGVLRGLPDEKTQPSSQLDVASLGKNDFLKLLIAQIQNQNPLDPASNTEFIAQLAQFSTLEKLTTMNLSLEKSLEFNKSVTESINNSMMVNFIGKTVTAESGDFLYDGLSSVELKFDLDFDISHGRIEIMGTDEIVIRSMPLDSMDKGLRSVTWEGLTSHGVQAKEGDYTYNVTVYDMVQNEHDASPVFTGVVEGITYKDGTTHLDIDGMLVPFDKITHIIGEIE